MAEKPPVLSPEAAKKLVDDAFSKQTLNYGNKTWLTTEYFRNHPDQDVGDSYMKALQKNRDDFTQSDATLRASIKPLQLNDFQNAGTTLTNECILGDPFLTRKADGTPALEQLQGNNLTIFALGLGTADSKFEVVNADPNTVCSELVGNAAKLPQNKTPQK